MEIKMYTTPVCGNCKTLNTWAMSKDIDITVCDITQDHKAKAKLVSKGITSVPVIEIDGSLYIDDLQGLKSIITDSLKSNAA